MGDANSRLFIPPTLSPEREAARRAHINAMRAAGFDDALTKSLTGTDVEYAYEPLPGTATPEEVAARLAQLFAPSAIYYTALSSEAAPVLLLVFPQYDELDDVLYAAIVCAASTPSFQPDIELRTPDLFAAQLALEGSRDRYMHDHGCLLYRGT